MSIEAMKQAMHLIDAWERGAYAEEYPNEITALRQAIEQAEKQEYSKRHSCPHCEREFACNYHQWVGLNWDDIPDVFVGDIAFMQGANWAQAKLKEKNT